MPNTPEQIKDVLDFCRSIRADQQPEYVPINAVQGAKPRDCYGNVAKKIKVSGGCALNGWAIWIEPDFFVEAEHHAVWVSPEGQKEDVSPQFRTNTVLFLPDPENEYKGMFIPNRRKALTDDPRMARWIGLAEEYDRLWLQNATPDGQGYTTVVDMVEVGIKMLHLQEEVGMPLHDYDVAEALWAIEFEEMPSPQEGPIPKQRAEARKKRRKRKK